MASSILRKIVKGLFVLYSIKKLFDKIKSKIALPKTKAPTPEKQKTDDSKPKIHPWRSCPIGSHWVVTHPLRVPPSKKRPGYITSRDGHCADNPYRSKNKVVPDYLSRSEIHKISNEYFSQLTGSPKADALGFPDGNKYDVFIRGWTKYWNEVLNPDEPLDPDLVKAIIFSESTFNPDAGKKSKKKDAPRGLMQIMDSTRGILADEKGELKDHLVNLTEEDAYDPNLNIAAGIRWLFRKKEIASSKLKRKATWDEAVAEYKSFLPQIRKGETPPNMQKFRDAFERLKS